MSHQKLDNPASRSSKNGSSYEMLNYDKQRESMPSPSKGIMGGWALEIALASAVMILPMLALTAVLLALVFGHQMPNHASTYTYDNKTELPLGSAFYVDYSATTLVYIASLSSTLSTVLISAAMILFSYTVARTMALESDANRAAHLPSPFQLQLLIRVIDGKITSLYWFLLYLLGRKHAKVKIVPMLWQAVAMLVALVLIAVLITLADLWLHLSTKPVQYMEIRPQAAPDWFHPGRAVNQSCLDNAQILIPNDTSAVAGCLVYRAEAAYEPVLINQTEFVKTAGNVSDINRVYLSDYKGSQYSVLLPAQSPDNLEYQATSYGSHTECSLVTSQCGAVSGFGNRDKLVADFNFDCNNTMAGLNMTGNFALLGSQNQSYYESSNKPSSEVSYNQSDTSDPIANNVNTMSPSPYDFEFGFQYFLDSTKQNQTLPIDTYGLAEELSLHMLDASITNQFYWALAFDLKIQLDTATSTRENNPWASLNLVADTEGGPEGILSCNTTISEITYRYSQSTLTILSTASPSPNASFPFINGITGSWGDEYLHQGLQQAFVRATHPSDLASNFASTYDQVLAAVPAGVLVSQPASNTTARVQTQVTRIARAPFVCLLLLNLLYAFVGVVLTATALVAVGLGRVGATNLGARDGRGGGGGVRDTQARLGVAAVVAESFEAPGLGEDASRVDDLFAERRGRVTRRVALGMGKGGGRRFRQVIVREEKRQSEGMGLVD